MTDISKLEWQVAKLKEALETIAKVKSCHIVAKACATFAQKALKEVFGE